MFIGLFLSLALASPAPATKPVTVQTLKRQEFARQQKDKAALRALGPMDLTQAIQITRKAGLLVAHSAVDTNNDFVRIKLHEPDKLCTLRVYKSDAIPGMQSIQFTLDDFSDPKIIYLQTEVLAPPGQLQIVGSWEMPDRERFVTLLEKYPSVDDQARAVPGEITLRVQELSDATGDLLNLVFDAPDLGTLQREHPLDVDKYVRPVLVELRAESLLSVDPGIGWQIFGPQATPDPKTAAIVQGLLPRLDAESFSARQSATSKLIHLGTPGAIALMHIHRDGLSPEQLARVDEILKPYHQLDQQQEANLSHQPEFLLDCLASDDPQLRQLSLNQLNKLVGHPIHFAVDAAAATRATQLADLRRQLLPKAGE